jgi:uncharacterized repeat protein (TIGR01451 family)
MNTRYAIALCIGLWASFKTANAQNTTCATATPVTSGTYWVLAAQGGGGFVSSSCQTGPDLGNDAQWFTYTAPATGVVTVSSCEGSISMESRVSVFMGSCGNLQCIASADNNCLAMGPIFDSTASTVTINVVGGFTYYIQWDQTFATSNYQWRITECLSSAQGTTYIDQNGNGIHEASEPLYPMSISVEPGGDWFFSEGEPYFHCVDIGTYTITPPPAPPHHTLVPPSRTFSITLPGEMETGLDFALVPTPGIFDCAVDLWGQNGWIGNNSPLHIDVSNIGTMPVAPHILLNLDPQVTFVSADMTPASSSAQAATWNLPVIMPGEEAQIQVIIFTSITAVPNGPMVHTVLLTTDEADVDATNNADNMHRIAATSIDPNDKQVSKTSITPDDVADQLPLEYEIRFQNTGTMPAVNIVVVDSLDGDWDLSTFQMIGTTHPYSLWMNADMAVWTFANIMLADSTTNEPESHGSIHYRMAPKTSLGLGAQITNRADIYFDYNDAVLTNTTVTTVEIDSGTDEVFTEQGLSVVPSPSSGLVHIQWAGASSATLTVLDALGRQVHWSLLAGLQHARPVDLTVLSPGTYIARVNDGFGSAHARFVIQR